MAWAFFNSCLVLVKVVFLSRIIRQMPSAIYLYLCLSLCPLSKGNRVDNLCIASPGVVCPQDVQILLPHPMAILVDTSRLSDPKGELLSFIIDDLAVPWSMKRIEVWRVDDETFTADNLACGGRW
jgi:hypothetical protein